MRTIRRVGLVGPTSTGALIALLVGLGMGCSDSSPPAAAAPVDAGVDAAVANSLTIWVYEGSIGGEPPVPLPGALVAFDPPEGGERVELTTEDDGHVTFEADFSHGPGSFTVYEKNHVMFTAIAASPELAKTAPPNPMGKPPTDIVVGLGPTNAGLTKKTVAVKGMISGEQKPSDVTALFPSLFGVGFENPANNFTLRAPKGRPFVLVGNEYTVKQSNARSAELSYVRMFRADVAALAADTVMNIDVSKATQLTPTTLTYRLELPGGEDGPFGGTGTGRAFVAGIGSPFVSGFIQKFSPANDGSGAFTVEVALVQETPPEGLNTVAVLQAQDGATSIRFDLGVTPSGTTIKDFALPPPMTLQKAKLREAIPLDGIPAGSDGAQLRILHDGEILWVIDLPRSPFPSEVKAPALPTGATLPTGCVAQVAALSGARLVGNVQVPTTLALSRTFGVSP